MEPCSTLTMAPFDSVCSEYLVSVPSDRYNGTIGVIFSDDFVTKTLGNRGLWELYCNGILPHVAVQTSPCQNEKRMASIKLLPSFIKCVNWMFYSFAKNFLIFPFNPTLHFVLFKGSVAHNTILILSCPPVSSAFFNNAFWHSSIFL